MTMKTLEKWLYQPQESQGNYRFSGAFYITKGIEQALSQEEILELYFFIKLKVSEQNGLDYLQVFYHKETQQKLFFIDQLSKEMLESGHYLPEDNYCTLLLASEY